MDIIENIAQYSTKPAAMFQKMKERGQTWKEILNRFGHPKDWEELKPKQLEML